jgi:hypothetical protein
VFGRITESQPEGLEHEDRVAWSRSDDVLDLLYVAEPCRGTDGMPVSPRGHWHPRWDDDDYGLILLSAPGTSSDGRVSD